MKTLWLCLAVISGAAASVAQQPFSWQIQPDVMPATDTSIVSTMAYDTTRGRAVFFPVRSTIAATPETWEWDGSAWLQVAASPLPFVRQWPSMTYDPVAQRTVLFGGFVYPALQGDTWTWNGASWTQSAPANAPGVRRGAGMFFDQVRQRVILVGGTQSLPSLPWNPALDRNDTWEWDGSDWVQLTPLQSPWPGPCTACYDPLRSRGVLLPMFGNSTWEWDGGTWTEVQSPQLPPLQGFEQTNMAFDGTRGRVLYCARGWWGSETWEWDGADWTQIDAGQVATLPIFFDSAVQATSMVSLRRLWRAQNVAAQAVAQADTYGVGCGSTPLQLTPASLPWIGQTAGVLLQSLPLPSPNTATAWLSAGFAPLSGVTWPTPACEVLHTSEVAGLSMVPYGPFARWELALPYDANLLGEDLYLQAFALAPGENPVGIVLSNGVQWQIGWN